MKDKILGVIVGSTLIATMTFSGYNIRKENQKEQEFLNNLSSRLEFKNNTIRLRSPVIDRLEEQMEIEKQKHMEELKQIKEKQEAEKKRLEEEKAEKRRQEELDNSIIFDITFYTNLPEENTESGLGVDMKGNPLIEGTIANNFLNYGDQIVLEGMGTYTVRDCGSPAYFNRINRIDMYIPPKNGESRNHYIERVNNMGRLKVKGHIVKKGNNNE